MDFTKFNAQPTIRDKPRMPNSAQLVWGALKNLFDPKIAEKQRKDWEEYKKSQAPSTYLSAATNNEFINMKSNPGRRLAVLSHAHIGIEAMRDIGEALEKNTIVQTLRLSHNEIACDSCQYINHILRENVTITDMDLSYNEIADGGICAIAEAIPFNDTVTKLRLEHNQFTDTGTMSLIRSLQYNSTLELITFGFNSCGPYTAQALGEVPHQLTSIQLYQNKLGDEGCTLLANGLKHSATIHVINVGANNIGDVGGCAFADFLKVNKSTQRLYLNTNQITEIAAEKIGESLDDNNTLTFLDLSCNNMDKEGIGHLARCEQRNRLKENQELIIRTDENVRVVREDDEIFEWETYTDISEMKNFYVNAQKKKEARLALEQLDEEADQPLAATESQEQAPKTKKVWKTKTVMVKKTVKVKKKKKQLAKGHTTDMLADSSQNEEMA